MDVAVIPASELRNRSRTAPPGNRRRIVRGLLKCIACVRDLPPSSDRSTVGSEGAALLGGAGAGADADRVSHGSNEATSPSYPSAGGVLGRPGGEPFSIRPRPSRALRTSERTWRRRMRRSSASARSSRGYGKRRSVKPPRAGSPSRSRRRPPPSEAPRRCSPPESLQKKHSSHRSKNPACCARGSRRRISRFRCTTPSVAAKPAQPIAGSVRPRCAKRFARAEWSFRLRSRWASPAPGTSRVTKSKRSIGPKHVLQELGRPDCGAQGPRSRRFVPSTTSHRAQDSPGRRKTSPFRMRPRAGRSPLVSKRRRCSGMNAGRAVRPESI